MDYNILIADFAGKNRICMTDTLYQYDYGQKLKIENVPALPQTFEAHFSNVQHGGASITVVGMDGIVDIPNTLLMTGKRIYCWIYVTEPGSGETEYQILIPVQARPMPEYYDVTDVGVFDSVVQQVGDYAATATAGATSATASAAAAATSASEAAASASAAETAKTAAETAQGKAENAQAAAETAAQTATEKAQLTAQDADQAALDAGRAESAAQRAEAAQTGAESAKTAAQTAAQGAATSASAASASAASAGQAATSAGQSATAAAGSATTASNAAQTATTKAGEASASATAAAASETAAQTAQTAAETAETNAGQSASTATTKAAKAAQSASNAAASKTAAEAAATRAETAAASLTVDDALSDTSTNPVQNKVITGEVTQLKNALTQTTGNTFIPLTATGKYIDLSGSTADITSPTNSRGSEYLVVECVAGDTFTITANGAVGSNGRAVGFLSSDGTVLAVAPSSTTYVAQVFTAPSNSAYLVVNSKITYPMAVYKNELVNHVALQSKSGLACMRKTSMPEVSLFDWENGSLSISGFLGVEIPSSYIIRTTNTIPYNGTISFTGVIKGDGESSNRIILVWEYDKDQKYLGRKSLDNVSSYTLKSACTFIRFTYGFSSSSGITVESYGINNLISDFNIVFSDIIGIDTRITDYNSNGTVSQTGNPVHLENTAKKSLVSLMTTGVTSGENITICGKNLFHLLPDFSVTSHDNTIYNFDPENGVIRVHASTGASADNASAATNYPAEYQELNGVSLLHNFHFTFKEDTVVSVSGNCSVYQGHTYGCKLQITDGTRGFFASNAGVTLLCEAGVEYGVRILTKKGWTGDITFKPQVEIAGSPSEWEKYTGATYTADSSGFDVDTLVANGSVKGITNIYTDGDAEIDVEAYHMTTKEQAEISEIYCNNIAKVTGNRFSNLYDRLPPRRPMVTFIDDDTSSVALVKRYHDIFANKGVVGNYAVMTKNLDDQDGLATLLLSYETEGFGCLYHCYYQSGDATGYWRPQTRDMELVRENFMTGLRSFREYGFVTDKHWVTPYGVNDLDIRNLAKSHSMESLIKMSSGLTSGEILTPYGKCDRWDVPRYTFSAASTSARYEALIDTCVETNGWLLIVSHVNTWGDSTDLDTKMANHIQYAIDAGVAVVSYPEAYEDFKSSFYLNELY